MRPRLVTAACLLACALLPPGVHANGWEHTAISPDILIEALEHPAEAIREQAAHSLGYHGGESVVDALTGVIAREEAAPRVRQSAFAALGRIGDAAALPVVKRCLAHEAVEAVRVACAEALGGLPAPESITIAIDALADASPGVRRAAVTSLGAFDDARAVAALAPLAASDGVPTGAVLRALGQTGNPAALEAVLPFLAPDTDRALLAEALKAVARLGGEAAAAPVEAVHAATADPLIRRLALIALAASGSAEAGAGLRAALAGEDPLAQIQALGIIRESGDPGYVGLLLEAGLPRLKSVYRRPREALEADPAAAVVDLALVNEYLRTLIALAPERGAVMFAVAAWPPPVSRDRPALLQVAEGVYRARWQAIYGLGYTSDPVVPLALEEAFASPDPRLRAVALRSMGVNGSAAFTPLLVRALEDSDAEVRRQAADVLGRLGKDDAATPLALALADADARVRRAAALSLGYLADPAARTALERARNGDPDAEVRELAGYALERIEG